MARTVKTHRNGPSSVAVTIPRFVADILSIEAGDLLGVELLQDGVAFKKPLRK